ncbi:hypothetical protein BDN71DRAFT_1481368 [Pleurotus eryngii]|uniref:Uncharacterized protein n=1 Tax=Pleurotus eryngii TaxID=5323 RepID=A0A9P6DB12_PLEER|nr:hypothetical protein BDN71DRAFT_1481368 [Pleurotus eryngii]
MAEYKYLSPEQVDKFLEDGYIVIKNAFTKEKAAEWTKSMWTLLGIDPDDKTTWYKERIHMPWHKRELGVPLFDLLGGEDRIDEESSAWGDSFVVNLGTDALEQAEGGRHPTDLDNWHVDGDFFVHFLDSPEQGLLVIPILSEIQPRGGGTFICPDGLDKIAKYLSEHPEGTLRGEYDGDPHYWSHLKEIKTRSKFVEMTRQIGDVVLLHPLMMHSASKNYLRIPRVITDPPVSLKEPFNFARESPNEYSLVERKTLKALGVERLDFKPTTERRKIESSTRIRCLKKRKDG